MFVLLLMKQYFISQVKIHDTPFLTNQVGIDDLCKMRDEFDHAEGDGGPERIRDAYVDNLRERFSKDHIYVSTLLARSRSWIPGWKDGVIREITVLDSSTELCTICGGLSVVRF